MEPNIKQSQNKTSDQSSTPNSRNKLFLTLILIASFVGFADASYLTVEHYLNATPPCSIGGCEIVLTSSYGQIFGIPVALLGVLFYMAVFFSALRGWVRGVKVLAIVGMLMSLGFLYLQLFVIKAICLYCMGSLATSTLNFIFSRFLRNDNLEILHENG